LANGLGTLGDLFPTKEISCRIRSCTNLLNFSGEEAMHKAAAGELERPNRMCDECFGIYRTLEDKQIPCSSSGCEGTWLWNRFQQLEARRKGHDTPPKGFCESCRNQIKQIRDQHFPCRVRGCEGKWVWTREEQIRSNGGKPPSRMCRDCWLGMKSLQDREIPCRLRGCKEHWVWPRYQQLEHVRAGKDLEAPPRRMCEECFKRIQALPDKQLPCKVDECDRTWLLNAYAQREHELAQGPDAELPSKMCKQCYSFFLKVRDYPIRCSNRGCKNTWLYTKSMQLHDWHNGRTGAPSMMCEECRKQIETGEPREVECMAPGCSRTWTYLPLDQVKDQCLGRREPTPRRCQSCDEFLGSHEPRKVPCSSCAKEINWSSYEQLLCELGTFEKPSLCSGCAEQKMALDRPKQAFPERPHHHVVRMPAGGKWASDDLISAWPAHLTYDVIDRAERAAVRIVALGDDLTYSSADSEETWPCLLEQALNRQYGVEGAVVVVNAGVPKCTSKQGLIRLPRDVKPFAPHLVITSFTFADSLLWYRRSQDTWRANLDEEEADESMDRLCKALKNLRCKLLYWTTNPMYPNVRVEEELGGRGGKWASTQQVVRNKRSAHDLHLCNQYRIPSLDLLSRFEVNGSKSARKWMSDWFSHNELGSRNIATWMAEHLFKEELIPRELPEDLSDVPVVP